MSDEIGKETNLTPEQMAAQRLAAQQILDYNPKLAPDVPPITSSGTVPPVGSVPLAPGTHAISQHLITTLGAVADISALKVWLNSALSVMETNLANTSVPTSNQDQLSLTEQALLNSAYQGSISFAQYQDALANPQKPASAVALKVWAKYQWSFEGTLEAGLYSLLARYGPYLDSLDTIATTLVSLQAYAFAPDPTTVGSDLNTNLTTIATAASGSTFVSTSGEPITNETIAGFNTVLATLTGATSEFANTFSTAASAIAQDCQLSADSGDFTTSMQQVLSSPQQNSGIGEIIAILETLVTLYNIYQATSFLSIAALEAFLVDFADQLLNLVIGEAMNMYAQIQYTLMNPILGLIRSFDSIIGFVPNAKFNKSLGNIDRFMNGVVVLLHGVVGQFNKYALDFFRRTNLHNQTSLNAVVGMSANNSLKNAIRLINELISILQSLNTQSASEIDWSAVQSKMSSNLSSQYCNGNPLPSVPSLNVAQAPLNSNLTTVVNGPKNGGTWGQVSTGSDPISKASSLLTSIQATRANL